MVNREELDSAFSQWQLDVTRSSPEQLEGITMEATARRMITEVGIPERIGSYVTMHDFRDGPVTVADFLRDPSSKMQQEAGDLLLLGSGNGTLLLKAETGEVFAWQNGEGLRICSSLETLVTALYLVQDRINAMENDPSKDWRRSRTGNTRRIVAELERSDESAAQTVDQYWRETITNCFRSVGF